MSESPAHGLRHSLPYEAETWRSSYRCSVDFLKPAAPEPLGPFQTPDTSCRARVCVSDGVMYTTSLPVPSN
eukprot:CAMPEP_0168470704 /NCGR_PEP_ID=MMETSP0228-20121227/58876_1 /TAXON_ID=133427 /ORGANISM="Protoceratium reticulatum, Strain CCCM 535 (=CCMP 1889)" /LENGTH=70 /DNA_ID=CAMNT_0008486535 /DNA_START=33 /DNA_END=242 /DNA_ORIENTATION=+